MKQIRVIAVGMADGKTLTKQAEDAIKHCRLLIGGERLLALFPGKRQMILRRNLAEVVEYIAANADKEQIGVLVSGDSGFYSYCRYLLSKLPADIHAEVICGISSLQYFCAKLQISYENIPTVSMHGRDGGLFSAVTKQERVFALTGGSHRVRELCMMLCERGGGALRVTVGENLGIEKEQITAGTATELQKKTFEELAVCLIENDAVSERKLPDKLAMLPVLLLSPSGEDVCGSLSASETAVWLAEAIEGDLYYPAKETAAFRRLFADYHCYNHRPALEEELTEVTALIAAETEADRLLDLLAKRPECSFALTVGSKETTDALVKRFEQQRIAVSVFAMEEESGRQFILYSSKRGEDRCGQIQTV